MKAETTRNVLRNKFIDHRSRKTETRPELDYKENCVPRMILELLWEGREEKKSEPGLLI